MQPSKPSFRAGTAEVSTRRWRAKTARQSWADVGRLALQSWREVTTELADGAAGAEEVTSQRQTCTRHTPWKTNMEVENGPLEDHFPLQIGGFPLPC